MLKIENLKKYYGNILGVEDIDLEIKDGEIFGFIGPNGAGKSTTIKCVLNFLNKDSGTILIDGKEITDKEKEEIGYLPSEVNLYDDLTVKQIIEYNNSFYKRNCLKRADYLSEKLELDVTKKIDELSLGNLKKVGIVLALMHSPKLVILDEPTSGLDPLMQEVFFELMLEEKKNGTSIFFSSHNLNEVKKICDRVAIIRKGRIIEVNEVKNIIKNKFVIITVKAKEIKKIKFPVKDMKIKVMQDNEITFVYQDDINKIVRLLKDIDVEELFIEEPTIEEIFMHYYKED
jgi:ABC-2 type transport system ATP-binding protein